MRILGTYIFLTREALKTTGNVIAHLYERRLDWSQAGRKVLPVSFTKGCRRLTMSLVGTFRDI